MVIERTCRQLDDCAKPKDEVVCYECSVYYDGYIAGVMAERAAAFERGIDFSIGRFRGLLARFEDERKAKS